MGRVKRRSPLAAAVALLVAAAALAVLSFASGAMGGDKAADSRLDPGPATVFDDQTTGRMETAWDWPQCVQIVANLRYRHPKVPLIVLLGGSSARESTFRDQYWTGQIERRGGPIVEAHNLASKHRTFAQDLEFAKLLPRGVKTIVFIGINVGRFCNSPTYPTIRLPRPNLDYVPKKRNIYYSSHIQSYATKRYYVNYWLSARWPEFRYNFSYNVGILSRTIAACKRRGLRPVLLDLPRDIPVIGHSFDAPVAMYDRACTRLSRRYHIPFLHFVGGIGLQNRDFFDIFHTVETGRTKYERTLSDRTIRLLKRYNMYPKPTPSPSPSPSVSPSGSPAPVPAG